MNRHNSALFRESARSQYWRNVANRHRAEAAAAKEAQTEMMDMHAEIQQLRQRLGEAEAFIRQNHEDSFQQDQEIDNATEDGDDRRSTGANSPLFASNVVLQVSNRALELIDNAVYAANAEENEHLTRPNNAHVPMPGGFSFQLGNQSLQQIDDATYDALYEQYGDAMMPTEQTFRDFEQFLADLDRARDNVAPFRASDNAVMVVGAPIIQHRRGFSQHPHKYATFVWEARFDDKPSEIRVESHKGEMVALIRDEYDRQCSICITKYEAGERVVVLPCAAEHRFHHDCVYKWHEESNLGCPMCRENFNWELAVKKKAAIDRDEDEESGEEGEEAAEEV